MPRHRHHLRAIRSAYFQAAANPKLVSLHRKDTPLEGIDLRWRASKDYTIAMGEHRKDPIIMLNGCGQAVAARPESLERASVLMKPYGSRLVGKWWMC